MDSSDLINKLWWWRWWRWLSTF